MKILNTDRVTWNGQPIAVVVAETFEQARHAASLVKALRTRQEKAVLFDMDAVKDGRAFVAPPTRSLANRAR